MNAVLSEVPCREIITAFLRRGFLRIHSSTLLAAILVLWKPFNNCDITSKTFHVDVFLEKAVVRDKSKIVFFG